ncbi:hypothetical protein ACFLR4_02635 [Bacteroidota bacterium]
MNNIAEYNDLCLSCNYTSLCTKRKNLKRPIWFCEEYDDFMPPQTNKTSISKQTIANSSFSNPKENPHKYAGICSNCEIRDTCQYPKPENGIWHCEEYR